MKITDYRFVALDYTDTRPWARFIADADAGGDGRERP